MTEALADGVLREEFRIGAVLRRTWSVQSRSFVPFFLVTALAAVPEDVLLSGMPNRGAVLLSAVAGDVIGRLGQAALLYGVFAQMRGRPVSLLRSVQFGFRRFLPVIGLAITVSLLIVVGAVVVVPGVIAYAMTFVATPVCVVEQLGVFASIERSAQLTKGHRWKILGMALLVLLPGGVVSALIDALAESFEVGVVAAIAAQVIWDGIWGAYYAVVAIATYHELRTVKDGVDIEQIAAVFA